MEMRAFFLVSDRRLLVAMAAGAVAFLALGMLPPHGPSVPLCPGGTQPAGAPLPGGALQWCERPGPDGTRMKHGPYVAWYANGRPKIEGQYREGAKEGRWVFWYPNGRRREEGGFQAGREKGPWSRWHANGRPLDAGDYREGARQGRWTFWYDNGRKEREGEFRDGVEVGPWARWSLKGEPCPPETPAA